MLSVVLGEHLGYLITSRTLRYVGSHRILQLMCSRPSTGSTPPVSRLGLRATHSPRRRRRHLPPSRSLSSPPSSFPARPRFKWNRVKCPMGVLRYVESVSAVGLTSSITGIAAQTSLLSRDICTISPSYVNGFAISKVRTGALIEYLSTV